MCGREGNREIDFPVGLLVCWVCDAMLLSESRGRLVGWLCPRKEESIGFASVIGAFLVM